MRLVRGRRGLVPVDVHELVRPLDRQRPEQDRVDDAEDRAVDPDPERERQEGDERAAGRLAEAAHGVAEALAEGFQGGLTVGSGQVVSARWIRVVEFEGSGKGDDAIGDSTLGHCAVPFGPWCCERLLPSVDWQTPSQRIAAWA